MPREGQPETPLPAVTREAAVEPLQELLRRTHLSAPSDVAAVVAEQAAGMGAADVALYLVDYELATLIPLATALADDREPLSVAGTIAGRAYSATSILRAPAEQPGQQQLWIPLLDGSERLGVIAMTFADELLTEGLVATCERYAHAVAMIIATKGAYGDAFEVTRRRRPMTIASELAWALAPPLVFATEDLALAGMLEPCYDNGGDALDYAVNGRVLHLAVFDAMGHGLAAAGVAAFAVAAYRHSRRTGNDLLATHAAMDEAVGQQFPGRRFVTAIIAQLDLGTGRLDWVSAGHPPPLILRGGRRVRELRAAGTLPLGIDISGAPATVFSESLEPGDMLLVYTDGLTDARDSEGKMFELDALSQFIEREAAAGQTAPELLRRLRHAILGRERADLRDDATALLVEWRRGSELNLVPQTVV